MRCIIGDVQVTYRESRRNNREWSLDSREDRESSVNLLLNSTVNTSKMEH